MHLQYPGVHSFKNAALNPTNSTIVFTHPASASPVGSTVLIPLSIAVLITYAKCFACSLVTWMKFGVNAACTMLIQKQFGKPRVVQPCRVRAPFFQVSVMVLPSRP